jgi:RHS repeat-associated protein
VTAAEESTSGKKIAVTLAAGEPSQLTAATSFAYALARDSTIDWDLDGRPERYDGYSITLAVGDQLLLTASSTAFDPVLILQKPTGGLATAFFDDSSGGGTTARLLVTADVAGTWTVVVTSRDELATGAYDLKIVKDQNALVPTALVEYDFTYDKAGNLTAATEDRFAVAQFGALGPAASGLGIATAYTVNALNQVVGYRHLDTANNNAVTKRAVHTYRADGTVGTVTRYAAAAGANPIGTSTAAYDGMGRITGITHAPTASPSITYGYAYDAASRIASMTTPEGTSSFALDATDQLLSASLTGETYAYDKTGNRMSGGTVTGTGNRLLSDGTYRYAYDAEGNNTAKFVDTNPGGTLSLGDTDVTLYAYDQRNRLVAVSHVNAWTATQDAGLAGFAVSGTPLPGSDLELRYTYDYADRRIRKSLDADGQAGAGQEAVSFAAYAGDVRTLEIARPNDKIVIDSLRGPIGFLGQVVQRTFYGNGVDEILAIDKVTWNTGTPVTSSFWTFTDHQDSVRDIVSGTGATLGQVVEHRQYDSFGKVVRRTTSPAAGAPATNGVGVEFAYAGRPFEDRTGLSDNRARWYEPATGRFINEDPSGFKGGDANLFRYVGNDPLNQVDPSGLAAKWASGAKASVPTAGWAALGQPGTFTPQIITPSTVTATGYASLGRQPAVTPALTQTPSPLWTTTSGSGLGNVSATQITMSLARNAQSGATPYSGLKTTVSDSRGRVYTPQSARAAAIPRNAQSPQWTLTDQEAKFAALAAYRNDNGGLLRAKGIDYDPANNSAYGRDGFSASLSYSERTNTYYLAYRGSEWSLQDWQANIAQGLGFRTSQYDQAVRLASEVNRTLRTERLIITGHSLGGGMAAAAAYATGLRATVFNPASVSPAYRAGTPGDIRSHVIFGDVLSVGRTIGNGIPDPAAPMNPNLRYAPGQVIVHPARTRSWNPVDRHPLNQFPD